MSDPRAEKKKRKGRSHWLSALAKVDPLRSLQLSHIIRDHFKGFFLAIILVHLAVAVVALVITLGMPEDKSVYDRIGLFVGVLGTCSLFSGLLILWSSIRSEAVIRQTYEFASRTSRAVTHHFETFEDHLDWITEHLTPAKFSSSRVHLYISVSTPVYGLAANDDFRSADLYLDFIEKWIVHFEAMKEANANPPTWELCFWKKEPHINTFCKIAIKINDHPDQQKRIERFATLCQRIYALNMSGRVHCELFFSDETHTRWFFLKAGEDEYAGLIVIFSPLSPSAIETGGWSLVGVSFKDKEAFENLSVFNFRLQHENLHKQRHNRIDILHEPLPFLMDHHGCTAAVPTDERPAREGVRESDLG